MKQIRNIIITSVLFASAALMPAHNGFEHVQGTVIRVENNVLIIETVKGRESVKLNAKTEITRDAKPAPAADLKAGTRVVVDVAEGDKDRVAHAIKLGVSPAANRK